MNLTDFSDLRPSGENFNVFLFSYFVYVTFLEFGLNFIYSSILGRIGGTSKSKAGIFYYVDSVGVFFLLSVQIEYYELEVSIGTLNMVERWTSSAGKTD